MERYAVIVAGGKGLRFGTDRPKQFLELNGRAILLRALENLLAASSWDGVRIVLPPEHMGKGEKLLSPLELSTSPQLIEGGKTRFHSVRNGIRSLPDPNKALVAVHDAARPLVRPELVKKILEVAQKNGSAVPAVPVKDSIRMLDEKKGSKGLDRERLRAVQTPQCFELGVLKKAMEVPHQDSFTDEANVMEHAGEIVHLCEGDPANMKITSQEDLEIAERLLQEL